MVLLLSYFVLIEAAGSDARGFNSQLLRNRRANLVFFIKNSVLSIFGFEPLAELTTLDGKFCRFACALCRLRRMSNHQEGTGCCAKPGTEANHWGRGLLLINVSFACAGRAMSSAGVSKADSLDSSETQPLWGSKPSQASQCWAP
jgi:hypothetical protein